MLESDESEIKVDELAALLTRLRAVSKHFSKGTTQDFDKMTTADVRIQKGEAMHALLVQHAKATPVCAKFEEACKQCDTQQLELSVDLIKKRMKLDFKTKFGQSAWAAAFDALISYCKHDKLQDCALAAQADVIQNELNTFINDWKNKKDVALNFSKEGIKIMLEKQVPCYEQAKDLATVIGHVDRETKEVVAAIARINELGKPDHVEIFADGKKIWVALARLPSGKQLVKAAQDHIDTVSFLESAADTQNENKEAVMLATTLDDVVAKVSKAKGDLMPGSGASIKDNIVKFPEGRLANSIIGLLIAVNHKLKDLSAGTRKNVEETFDCTYEKVLSKFPQQRTVTNAIADDCFKKIGTAVFEAHALVEKVESCVLVNFRQEPNSSALYGSVWVCYPM